MKPILHSKPGISGPDRAAVEEVLRSDMLAQGEKTEGLERAFWNLTALHIWLEAGMDGSLAP